MSALSLDVQYESIISLHIQINKISRTTMAFVFTAMVATIKIWSDIPVERPYLSQVGLVIIFVDFLIIMMGLFSEIWLRQEKVHLLQKMEEINPQVNVLSMSHPFKRSWPGTSNWFIIIYIFMLICLITIFVYLFA